MTESIGTARLDIVVDTSSLDAGVTKAKRSTADMSKAAQDASQKMDAGTKRQVQSLERQIATLGKSRAEVIKWRIEQQTSGRVAAELTAKLDAQQRGLAASAVSMSKFGEGAKRAALGLAAIAIAAGGSLAVGVKNAIDFADKLNDINIRLGISAEALSGWAFAAQQSGTDIDALGLGLQRLAKNMAEALDAKSKQAGLFKALGVEIKDAKGNLRSLEDVLPDIASKFRDVDNATTKAALAQELFGKSGTNLLEFLNLGGTGIEKFRREAKDLGLELSGSTLKSADEFKDQLSKLGTLGQAAGLQLAERLIPPLTELVKAFQQGIQPGGDIAKVIHWMGNEAEAASADIKQLKSDFNDFAEIFLSIKAQAESTFGVLRSFATLDFSGAKKSLADLLGARERTLAALTKDRFQFANVRSGSSSTEEEEPDRKTGGLDSSLAGFLGGGREAKRSKARKEDPVAKALEEARKLAAAEKEVQAQLDALDDAKFKAIEGWAELTAQLNGPLAEAELDHAKRMAEIQRLGALSGATAEQIAAAKAKETAAYQGATEAIREQLDALENPGRVEALDNLRQIGYDFLVDLPKQGKDAWKNLLDDLERMATQWAAKGIIERLFGAPGTTGAGTSGGDWIGKILGAFSAWNSGGLTYANGGAFFNGRPVEAFANGGIFDRPTAFGMSGGRLGVMGEAGPEAIMPLERGRDNKLGVRVHGDAGSRRGDFSQTVNLVVQGRVDARTQQQIAQQTGREARRAMMRNGG